jgi:uncharacterized protein YdeI (YjbR/CyaY-like superfamily)
MGKRDKRIDAYIQKSAEFAKPILTYIRESVHVACPEVEETIKWGMPSFEYKGPYFSMAAFKAHCSAGFWKASLLKDPGGHLQANAMAGGSAMGHFGRITSLNDLPPGRAFLGLLQQARRLNDDGVKVKRQSVRKKEIPAPPYFLKALKRNKKAEETFKAFPPGHRREYLEWIVEARTDETRQRRMATAIKWMSEGKPRNWKYMKKKT